MGEVSIDDARAELEAARDALGDARVLLDGDGSDAGVCNRLYYAAFHAAQAALYVREVNPASHGAVRRQFGQHLVLDGDASREEGRLLGDLYDHRQEADYRLVSLDVDVEALVSDVDAFVAHMEALVQERVDSG
ncbi:MAG: HEPN domain-containing protein [Halobacteriales archaeon]